MARGSRTSSKQASAHTLVAAILLSLAAFIVIAVAVTGGLLPRPETLGDGEDSARGLSPLIVESVETGYLVVRNIGWQEVRVNQLYIMDPTGERLLGAAALPQLVKVPPGAVMRVPLPPSLAGVADYGDEVTYILSGARGPAVVHVGPFLPPSGAWYVGVGPRPGWYVFSYSLLSYVVGGPTSPLVTTTWVDATLTQTMTTLEAYAAPSSFSLGVIPLGSGVALIPAAPQLVFTTGNILANTTILALVGDPAQPLSWATGAYLVSYPRGPGLYGEAWVEPGNVSLTDVSRPPGLGKVYVLAGAEILREVQGTLEEPFGLMIARLDENTGSWTSALFWRSPDPSQPDPTPPTSFDYSIRVFKASSNWVVVGGIIGQSYTGFVIISPGLDAVLGDVYFNRSKATATATYTDAALFDAEIVGNLLVFGGNINKPLGSGSPVGKVAAFGAIDLTTNQLVYLKALSETVGESDILAVAAAGDGRVYALLNFPNEPGFRILAFDPATGDMKGLWNITLTGDYRGIPFVYQPSNLVSFELDYDAGSQSLILEVSVLNPFNPLGSFAMGFLYMNTQLLQNTPTTLNLTGDGISLTLNITPTSLPPLNSTSASEVASIYEVNPQPEALPGAPGIARTPPRAATTPVDLSLIGFTPTTVSRALYTATSG